MSEVRVRPSSPVERVAAATTLVLVAAAQIAAGLEVTAWWVGGLVGVVAFAAWTAVHANALDRPRVAGSSAALLIAFATLSVVVGLFWRSTTTPAAMVVVFTVIQVMPLGAYFVMRR